MKPTTCPCGNTSLLPMTYGNRAYCENCEAMVEIQDDGTTKVWDNDPTFSENSVY